MTSEYTHYSASAEQRFKDGQTSEFKGQKIELKPKQLLNQIFKQPIAYYDSPFKKSSLYPNIQLFKAVDYESVPPNIGKAIDKSIADNKMYAVGPHIMPKKEYNYWS